VHSRSGDNLTAHPEAAGIIRQASGFPRFDEFLGPRFALPAVQLDHPHGIWQVKTKLPHRVNWARRDIRAGASGVNRKYMADA
jgi:hypothetical protein